MNIKRVVMAWVTSARLDHDAHHWSSTLRTRLIAYLWTVTTGALACDIPDIQCEQEDVMQKHQLIRNKFTLDWISTFIK